jgi:hypothetical protein
VTGPDQTSTGPDGYATFTFDLHASSTQAPGTGYKVWFNLRAYALAWFDYATLNSYYIPIEVDLSCNPGPC